MKKTKVKMNKPIYLGLPILEISKISMHEFWYHYMKPKHNDNVRLCYMDTDSFVMHIETNDFYKDIASDIENWFDTSNYEINRSFPTGKNKKVTGLMKDELVGKIITEFVTLRPKTYSFLTDDGKEDKKAKGTKKCVIKKMIKFNDYKKCLLNDEVMLKPQQRFLDTLLKRNNGEISVLVYRKPTHTDQYLHYSSHHQTSCKESVVSSLFNRAYSIITNKADLHKENARIKQVLKENGYQESIISKIFKRITYNHSLPQLQQQTQAADIQEEEIKMSIYLPYVEGTSEKLRRILRSHKIRSTFYTENTLRKLLCKPKDQVATEDKNNIVYEIDCSNCEAVYFGESKRSLKSRSDEHKRSVRNCDCDKNEIAKHCWEADHNFNWDQKKVVDRESRLIPRKIKETIHSLKNPNHINKISYMLPEIWLPNLR